MNDSRLQRDWQRHPVQFLVPPFAATPPLPHRWLTATAPSSMDTRRLEQKKAKKRTKTGCATCRKRRIKCDENRPYCRNCEKSRRSCLGYEVTREQRESSSLNIHPAPPQGSSTAGFQDRVPIPPRRLDVISRLEDNDGTSPFARNMVRGADLNALLPQRKVRHIDIEDLFSLNDIPPNFDVREAPPALDPTAQQIVANFCDHHYMNPLDKFFETTWYSANGLACIRQNPVLNDFIFQVAQRMRDQVDSSGARYATSLEARLVWKLAIMPRDTVAAAGSTDLLVENLVPRIDAVEKLLTGQFLEPSQVPPAALKNEQESVTLGPSSSGADHDATYQANSFWYHLCRFTSLHDDAPDTSTMHAIDTELLTIRNLLGQRETRDILYSIAILRFIGGRTRDFHPQRHILATTNNAEENTSKLKVAQTFLDREAAHGTDQVTQRMCAMAMRGLGLWRCAE